MIDLRGPTMFCGQDCPAFIEKWEQWWREKTREPVALIECVGFEPLDDYLTKIGGKSRNMVNKANRLYEYRKIVYNDHLDGIAFVARSKSVRQGIPMQGWYAQPLTPTTPAQLCAFHCDDWHAGFNRETGQMVSFARIEILNELGILNSILGDTSAGGSVNGLVAHLVEHAGVRWINYLFPGARTQSLADFKARLGFEAVQVE